MTNVDMDRLERDVRSAVRGNPPPLPPPLLPPLPGQAVSEFAPRDKAVKHTPLQLIAHAITRLTWTDAEAMGEAIQSLLAKEPAGSSQNVTAAIQGWAAEWEKFES